jgi:hypothetical protein
MERVGWKGEPPGVKRRGQWEGIVEMIRGNFLGFGG